METSDKVIQKSNQNSETIKLVSEKDRYRTSLIKLNDKFAYVQNRANINLNIENKILSNIHGISENSFINLTAVLNG